MFGDPKVKIPKDLWQRIQKLAQLAGYSSPEEFVRHALEKEISKLDDAESDEEIKKKLRGLGYIS